MAHLVYNVLYIKNAANYLQLYEDVGSFRSIIKRAVQEAVPPGYVLYAPPGVISREARITFLKDKAATLLQNSEYLQGGVDAHVSESIMAVTQLIHLASGEKASLRSSGSQASMPFCVLLEHKQVPSDIPRVSTLRPKEGTCASRCNGMFFSLPLVVAHYGLQIHFVLHLYKSSGKDINPKLNSKELEAAYLKFLNSIETIASHRSKGNRLSEMLADWAAEGM